MSKNLLNLKGKTTKTTTSTSSSSTSLPASSVSTQSSGSLPSSSTSSSFLTSGTSSFSLPSSNVSSTTTSSSSAGIAVPQMGLQQAYLPFIGSASGTANYSQLNEFGFAQLQALPEISRFIIPDIIPDLLDIYKTDGPEEIINMITKFVKAGETEISNILFYNKHQQVHHDTYEIEKDLIKNVPEVEESEDYICSNAHCRSRKLRVVRAQTRSADEALSVFTHCTQCHRVEKRAN